MASTIAEMLQQLGYYQSGGQAPGRSTTEEMDKLASTLGGIGKLGLEYGKYSADIKKADLESKRLEAETRAKINEQIRMDLLKTGRQVSDTPITRNVPTGAMAGIGEEPVTSAQTTQITEPSEREQFIKQYGYTPETTLGQAKDIATVDATKALAKQRENPKLNDFSPAFSSNAYNIDTVKEDLPNLFNPDGSFKGGREPSKGEIREQYKNLRGREAGERQERNAYRQFEFQKALKVFENTLPTADMKNKGEIAEKALVGVDVLGQLLNQIPEGFEGGVQSLVGKTGMAYEEAGTYDRLKKSFAASMYRAVTGDTRLSDEDAQARAYPLMPQLWHSNEQRDMLLAYDKYLMKQVATGAKVNLEEAIANAPKFKRPEGSTVERIDKPAMGNDGTPPKIDRPSKNRKIASPEDF